MPAHDPKLAEERRQSLIRAAASVMAHKGYHAAGVSSIAREAGVAHGTFYLYFKNKRDVLDAIISDIAMRIAGLVDEESPSSSDDLESYRAQLIRIGGSLFELIEQDRTLGRLLFYESFGADPEAQQQIERLFTLLAGYTEQYMRNGVAKGFMRANLDTFLAANTINAIIFEAARRIVNTDEPQEVERWLDFGADFVLRALAQERDV